MPAAITDLATQATNGTRPTPTTLTALKAIGASSISCGALTGWATGTAVHLIIYTLDTSGNKVAGSQTDWKGVVSGSSITNLTLKAGTDNGYSIGAVVEAGPTAAYANDIYSAITQDHDVQGRHSKLTDTNGNKIVGLNPVASAVNDLVVSNAAAGGTPDIAAEGTDTDISMTLTPKGKGGVVAQKRLDGWVPGLTVPNTVVYNGGRNYTLTFNTLDLTPFLSPGQRLKLTRTVTAPTQCTSLNGTTQYFSKSSPAGMGATDNITVMAWIKINAYGSNMAIASRSNGSTDGWYCQVDTVGRIQLAGARAADDYVLTVNAVPLNKWTHIAITINSAGAVGTAYFDGVSVPVTFQNNANSAFLAPTQSFLIGAANGASPTSFFNGKLAQVAVFSAVIAQATVQSYISQTLSGSETSEVSAYSFNNSINDLNANANNLTANGSAVATNADSPFAGGGSAATAYTAGTTEYGEVFAISFSTNTTLTVQVPNGYAIPTSGGVSALAYSVMAAPLGWPAPIVVLGLAELTANYAPGSTAETDIVGLAVTVNVPTGRDIKITGKVSVFNTGGADQITLRIKEGSTTFDYANANTIAANKVHTATWVAKLFGVTAGNHTYKISIAGTVANPSTEAIATEKNSIMVEVM